MELLKSICLYLNLSVHMFIYVVAFCLWVAFLGTHSKLKWVFLCMPNLKVNPFSLRSSQYPSRVVENVREQWKCVYLFWLNLIMSHSLNPFQLYIVFSFNQKVFWQWIYLAISISWHHSLLHVQQQCGQNTQRYRQWHMENVEEIRFNFAIPRDTR